mmetsp:Transcript_8191/g.23425  ORF Transcript_8191/g.23425 Transcript_8191/m.23425 type:complete len:214 (+) Transcript_8191:614-1255(+)
MEVMDRRFVMTALGCHFGGTKASSSSSKPIISTWKPPSSFSSSASEGLPPTSKRKLPIIKSSLSPSKSPTAALAWTMCLRTGSAMEDAPNTGTPPSVAVNDCAGEATGSLLRRLGIGAHGSSNGGTSQSAVDGFRDGGFGGSGRSLAGAAAGHELARNQSNPAFLPLPKSRSTSSPKSSPSAKDAAWPRAIASNKLECRDLKMPLAILLRLRR